MPHTVIHLVTTSFFLYKSVSELLSLFYVLHNLIDPHGPLARLHLVIAPPAATDGSENL